MHVLSDQNHLMEPVQQWVRRHLVMLRGLTKQRVTELDLTDDRLGLCLEYLHASQDWHAIEEELGVRLIRVYALDTSLLRLDATVGALQVLGRTGVLVVGDSKMSTLTTRPTIVAGQDYYLTPLAEQKDEPDLLPALLECWHGREDEAMRIFLPEDFPPDGSQPAPDKAIADGFTVSRQRTAQVSGQAVSWEERLLVVRSLSHCKTIQAGLQERLDKAGVALRNLTPARQRGKPQLTDEASLLAAIGRIEQQYRVQGLCHVDYQAEVTERPVRSYRGQPANVER